MPRSLPCDRYIPSGNLPSPALLAAGIVESQEAAQEEFRVVEAGVIFESN